MKKKTPKSQKEKKRREIREYECEECGEKGEKMPGKLRTENEGRCENNLKTPANMCRQKWVEIEEKRGRKRRRRGRS